MKTSLKKSIAKLFSALAVSSTLMFSTVSPVMAMAEVSWEQAAPALRADGFGVPPAHVHNLAQGRLMARRAAIMDAHAQLLEAAQGFQMETYSSMRNYELEDYTASQSVSGSLRGAQIVSEGWVDGAYHVEMQLPMFGQNSLASTIFRPVEKEPFPAPAGVPTNNVNVNVNVNSHGNRVSNGPLAAPAPEGRPVGNYTGLVIDARGLGLQAVMSPVIKREDGTPIYGYKNLDYDKVIAEGMASYDRTARAGANPLVIRAVGVDGHHHGNPVVSDADAARILIENASTGFLDRTRVVFLR